MLPDGRPRVLVADDAPALVERVIRLIEETGRFEVAGAAHDGGEAHALYLRCAPCTLILDLNMPVMTGLELTRRLRGQGHDCIIYIMTSAGAPEVRAACLAAGANRFFDKLSEFDKIIPALIADHADTNPS